MAWSSTDWEPWVVFVVCLVATAVLTGLLALLCHRRSRLHRRNQVDILSPKSGAPIRPISIHPEHIHSANATTPLLLSRSAIRLDARLSDGRFGQRHSAILVQQDDATTLYTRAVQVDQLDVNVFTHAQVSPCPA